jgi:hypothetical protein
VTPHEALRSAIGFSLVESGMCRGKPGAIVARMGAEARAALQQLTAADIAHPQREWCVISVTPAERHAEDARRLRCEFDRQLRHA